MSFQSDLGDHVRQEYCHCPPHFEMPRTFRCSLCHKIYLPGWENKSGFRKERKEKMITERSNIQLFNQDCMEAMKEMPDKAFDLAIVDPPYGIGVAKTGKVGGGKLAKVSQYKPSEWDSSIPPKEYFQEIQRISRNQIIWGGNYFLEHLTATPCFIVWDKVNTGNFADCELAWTSFSTATKKFKFMWNGMLQQDMKNKEHRIHPTQKPVALYKWLLQNYAKEGNKILDTHLGSGSIAIACWDMGFNLTGYEIDADYFKAATERLERHKAQGQLF